MVNHHHLSDFKVSDRSCYKIKRNKISRYTGLKNKVVLYRLFTTEKKKIKKDFSIIVTSWGRNKRLKGLILRHLTSEPHLW